MQGFTLLAARETAEEIGSWQLCEAPETAECGAWTAAFLVFVSRHFVINRWRMKLSLLLLSVIVRYGLGSDLIMSAR